MPQAESATPKAQGMRQGAVFHFVDKNMFLMGILLALSASMSVPGPGKAVAGDSVTSVLVAAIFLGEGTKLDLAGLKSFRRFIPIILWGVAVSLILGPVLGGLGGRLLGLSPGMLCGLLIMCSIPSSLASATTLSARANGDLLTTIILLVALNALGLVSIPLNLELWTSDKTVFDPIDLARKLVLLLFLPIIAGQLLKRFFPDRVRKSRTLVHVLPTVCITLIVYISCSREASFLADIKLGDLAFLFIPCLAIHLSLLSVGYLGARYMLKLQPPQYRACALICSERPMSLSVVIWSMSFAHIHPVAIFPIIVYYIGQLLADSTLASIMTRRDIPVE